MKEAMISVASVVDQMKAREGRSGSKRSKGSARGSKGGPGGSSKKARKEPASSGRSTKLPTKEIFVESDGLAFDRVTSIPGTTYKDNSTVIVIPSRGMVSTRVVERWLSLIAPMNQKRALLFAVGHEVGQAYNALIQNILAHPELSKFKYVMTLEDDNLPPPDAHVRLLESIEWGSYDAVSAIYFTKGEMNMPMAYGDPNEFKQSGVLDFRPRDVKNALAAGQIMPVNGIAMGCALWRMELFRQIESPWFVTVADVVDGKGVQCYTQDLNFCSKAVTAGKRFAVDLRVRVGHLDVNSGIVY